LTPPAGEHAQALLRHRFVAMQMAGSRSTRLSETPRLKRSSNPGAQIKKRIYVRHRTTTHCAKT
jgi:hypothetical protein